MNCSRVSDYFGVRWYVKIYKCIAGNNAVMAYCYTPYDNSIRAYSDIVINVRTPFPLSFMNYS